MLPPQETTAGTATVSRDAASGAELKQIALSFLRLGTTAFGGPAAHIAMMEEEFVRRRGWVSYTERREIAARFEGPRPLIVMILRRRFTSVNFSSS